LNSCHETMDKESFTSLLLGKDLRTIRQNGVVVNSIHDQHTFDELFSLVFHHERTLVMRAIDAVEKVTSKRPEFLITHKYQLLEILNSADHKELKWHIAQLITRVDLSRKELEDVWHILTYWTQNKNESRIVRVNSLQGLFDLSRMHPEFRKDFDKTVATIERERVPSIRARIRRIRECPSLRPDASGLRLAKRGRPQRNAPSNLRFRCLQIDAWHARYL